MKKSTTQIGVGLLSLVLTAVCFYWMFWISPVSFGYCTSSYVAHTEYQCQMPFFALMLCLVFGGVSYFQLAGGIRRMKRVKKVIKRQKASANRPYQSKSAEGFPGTE